MGHDHEHALPSAAPGARRRLAIAFCITAVVLVAEVVGAIITGSMALLVDAAHMLTDAGGLGIALLAANLAMRPATSRRTWGWARIEVLAAAAQAGVLLAVGLFVLVEGIQRLLEPPDVPGPELLLFGVIGLVGNVMALVVLFGGRGASLNARAAFLEVANDALGSMAVIVAAIVIALTGWARADVVASLVIAGLIVPRTIALLREAVGVLLESTPKGLDLDAVRAHLEAQPHVLGVHDLHSSLIATGLPVLTAHIVVEESCFHDGHAPAILDALQECVGEHFEVSVEHTTFQLEPQQHASHEHGAHE